MDREPIVATLAGAQNAGFAGFEAPTQRLALRNEHFFAEVWPELGGALASFEWRSAMGGISRTKPLFRSTRQQRRYLPTDLACFPLVPYSNRIAAGRIEFAGQLHRLPRNCAGFVHPLHGIGWLRSWEVLERDDHRCVLRVRHDGDVDWPCAFTAFQEIALTESGLSIRLRLTNEGVAPMPYGLGLHPYVRRPPATRIFAQVAGVWLCDADQVPTHRVGLPPHWNLPEGPSLDETFVDHCFDGLQGDVRVQWPDGTGLRISSAPTVPFLVLHGMPGRNFFCIEPVTQRPNAFNSDPAGRAAAGVGMLAPRESAALEQRFDFVGAEPAESGGRGARP
jgi:aldose 1-epimerase